MILRRFLSALRDNRGVAAVEFGLMLPLLVMLTLGMSEFTQAYQAQKRLAHVAAATADITAQTRAVTVAETDDIMNAATSLIYPFGTVSLGQRISSLSSNSSGTITVDWSVKKNYNLTGTPTVPAGYLLANESLIVTDVVYDYRPTFGLYLPTTIRFIRHAYVRPRLSTTVQLLP
jgi:Flp pilus assembly protein TadG